MTTTKTTDTLRSQAFQAVLDSASEAVAFEHERNYHRLHVHRDGTVSWTEFLRDSDDMIDQGAERFQAVPSVASVGTGSYGCNCHFCLEVYSPAEEALALDEGREYDRTGKYGTRAEAVTDAVSNSDWSDIVASMTARFEDIPEGYFNDEEVQ